jgi:hypothetical protein
VALAPIPNASVRWNPDQSQVTGNLILLFTDGIDNISHARLEDAIDMCQRSKYPPAEPEALRCEPLKAASLRRLALSRFLSLLLHLFFP